MQGYAIIGSIYLLRESLSAERLVWMVVENNSNDKTTTLSLVEKSPECGKRIKVDAQWLCEREPIGPIFPVAGEIMIENGIEFIKLTEEKAQSRLLKPKKTEG